MASQPRSPLHARIGRRVRARRKQKGWTQAHLAEAVGCSNHFISGIERGVDSPSLLTLETVADALSTSVGALVAEEQSGHSHAFYELEQRLQGRENPQLIRVLRDVIDLYDADSEPRRQGSSAASEPEHED